MKKIEITKSNKMIKEYFKILEPQYPYWLNDYINVEELQKQKYISITCGTIYSKLFESKIFYSSLEHSIAVALIIWHFTHDKKQTLAGLFHDIATPAFKHCIDFLNGDYMTQESTESLTTEIIKNSEKIMKLLKRDNIEIEEICDYHIYPIADNDTPKLSADRLEYSLSNALFTYESIIYREDKTRYSMQFLADVIKKLNEEGKIQREDLYNMKDIDIINIIEKSKYRNIFEIWKKAEKINTSKNKPEEVYYVHHGAKIRYINPLVGTRRIREINENAKNMIENNLSYDMSNYVFLDFEF